MTKQASFPTRRSTDHPSAPSPVVLPSASGAALPKYLTQRSKGVYYFKRKVLADLVPGFDNQAQIWKSLETTDFNQACRLLTKEIAAFELRIATVRMRMVAALPCGLLTIAAGRKITTGKHFLTALTIVSVGMPASQ